MIQQLIKPRHAATMRAMRECAERIKGEDEKIIVLVYDGPRAVVRELSYWAPDHTQNDVRLICEAVAAQVQE